MASPRSDLFVVLGLVGLDGLILWLWPGLSPLRSILGILLVLALPGYALEAALLDPGRQAMPIRLLIIVGLSLAVAIIGGLALYWTPLGLQTGTWYLWMGGITTIAGLVGLWRFPRYRPRQRKTISPISLRPLLLLSVAFLIAGAAVYVSRLPAPPDNAQGYTQLWMVPVAGGVQPSIRLGISSSEFSLVKYRLQVTVDGGIFLDQLDITLAPGDKWERTVMLSASQSTTNVEAVLYRLDDPSTVYRRVKLQPDPSSK